MRIYTKPELQIEIFEKENIITVSFTGQSADVDSLETKVKNIAEISYKNLDFVW